LTETVPHENPLIPNKKLQQMFVAMVEMRLLDEHIAGLQRSAKARRRTGSSLGEEACRVSTAIDLVPGDLVSDSQAGVAMEMPSGARVASLLKYIDASMSKSPGTKAPAAISSTRQLPWIEDIDDRLGTALGAALALKTLKGTNILVAYLRDGDASNRLLRKVLTFAAKHTLPIIFVLLPQAADGKKRSGRAEGLSVKARSCGVPSIPVDASDAVALYRVAQESTGRTRDGGGPVLVECIAYPAKGGQSKAVPDPLVQMKSFLLDRRVCTEAWLTQAGSALRKQITRS
jgi:TPP-dependent pyruvate/acetoin dehydrogenase alpha subunit